MAYLGSEKLKELIITEKVVSVADGGNVDLSRVVCGAYELSLGEEIFRTDSKDKKKEFLSKAKEQVTINPGQFALLLTHETVTIPINKIAFISIKAGIKLKGLVNVSGFHVDPGFNGKLVFSVYNAGSAPVSLVKGEPCFLIWFAELALTANEETSYAKGSHEHRNQDSIPVKYIDSLLAGELASPSALLEKIDSNKKELDNRINIVDERKKFNEYLFKAIIGLLIVIGLRLMWDAGRYYKGYKDGYDKKTTEMANDSAYRKMQYDYSALYNKVDSLLTITRKAPESKK